MARSLSVAVGVEGGGGHTSKVGAKDPGVVQEWQLLMITEHVPDPVLGACASIILINFHNSVSTVFIPIL